MYELSVQGKQVELLDCCVILQAPKRQFHTGTTSVNCISQFTESLPSQVPQKPNFGVGPLNGGMTVYYVQNGNVTAPPKVISQRFYQFQNIASR